MHGQESAPSAPRSLALTTNPLTPHHQHPSPSGWHSSTRQGPQLSPQAASPASCRTPHPLTPQIHKLLHLPHTSTPNILTFRMASLDPSKASRVSAGGCPFFLPMPHDTAPLSFDREVLTTWGDVHVCGQCEQSEPSALTALRAYCVNSAST